MHHPVNSLPFEKCNCCTSPCKTVVGTYADVKEAGIGRRRSWPTETACESLPQRRQAAQPCALQEAASSTSEWIAGRPCGGTSCKYCLETRQGSCENHSEKFSGTVASDSTRLIATCSFLGTNMVQKCTCTRFLWCCGAVLASTRENLCLNPAERNYFVLRILKCDLFFSLVLC